MQGSADSHQWGAGAALGTGPYVPPEDTMSENRRVMSDQIDIQSTSFPEPSDDMSLCSHASVVSLFQPPTILTELSTTVSIEDSEMEPPQLASSNQEEGATAAASSEPILESSTRVGHHGSGEALEDMAEMTPIPDNGRP